ncbi:MAG: uroporphyrinogen-III synthase [Micropruina sp.]|nr:uroporphyrinogen-III synthase [Micropruina sp.]
MPDQVRADWESGRFDAIVLTAGSAARAAASLLGVRDTPVVALGDSTATVARNLGFRVLAVATTPDGPGLARALHLLVEGSA